MGVESLSTCVGPAAVRRHALKLGYVNGLLWSIGNGLTSGSLITYLAIDLGAEGVGVSLVLAVQALVGVLRVVSPKVITLAGGARRACLLLTLASYTLIFLLPAITLLGSPLRALEPVPTLIVLLCVHQLLEQLGTVALWTWWADLVPLRVRGRYFGRRNTMQLAALIPTVWASGWFVDMWKREFPELKLAGYAIVTGAGAAFLLASIVPLFFMPERIGRKRRDASPLQASTRRDWRTMLAPLSETRFRRVLCFGLWFSLVNGLTQSAQNIYPKQVLGIGLTEQAAFVTLMRLGQAAYSLWVGPFSDRYGNRPALVLSQLVQAGGMAFFVVSSPGHDDWLYGAWIAWSAFAGINICIPNLLLKLAPRGQTAAYVGIYMGLTGAIYAAGAVGGGFLHDALKADQASDFWSKLPLDFYHLLFLCGWVLRSMAVLWLVRIIEQGAWRWREILNARRARQQGDSNE
ncbi:MAG TPA: MFS transporter [Pirellulales bacterium]|nr:MFS transporter [Pirellulales bacterium]